MRLFVPSATMNPSNGYQVKGGNKELHKNQNSGFSKLITGLSWFISLLGQEVKFEQYRFTPKLYGLSEMMTEYAKDSRRLNGF